MLYEFALEPSLLYQVTDTPRNYTDFIQRFTVGTPAVISDFPELRNFRRQVLKDLDTDISEMQKTRIEDALRFLSETPRVQRNFNYDRSMDWKTNVTVENSRVAFDYVVCSENNSDIGAITLDTLYVGDVDYPKQLAVKRVAADMSAAIANMLRLSSKIVFIDPYFCSQARMWNPFIDFCQAAIDRQPGESLEIEILFSNKGSGVISELVNKIRNEHAQLKSDCSITFKKIKERPPGEKIHNRYILTDIGGVTFGIGLDEKNSSQTDDVTLLDKDIYDLRWSQYVDLNEFDVLEEEIA